MVEWRAGQLMCPSWGEAGQKWLSVELNWLHYRSSALESINDITHPSQTGSHNSQRKWWEQPICRMEQSLWFRCVYACKIISYMLGAKRHREQATLQQVSLVSAEECTHKHIFTSTCSETSRHVLISDHWNALAGLQLPCGEVWHLVSCISPQCIHSLIFLVTTLRKQLVSKHGDQQIKQELISTVQLLLMSM